jgi:methylated-DNA-protein-cysteine methyltransferase-like protein
MFRAIHAVIRRIPKGRVSTYGKVAEAAGYPGASRQVVWALRAAGGGLPWQRVVGAGGAIRLPGANGLEQRFLLEAEGVKFRGSRVRMDEHEHMFPATRKWKRAAT